MAHPKRACPCIGQRCLSSGIYEKNTAQKLQEMDLITRSTRVFARAKPEDRELRIDKNRSY